MSSKTANNHPPFFPLVRNLKVLLSLPHWAENCVLSLSVFLSVCLCVCVRAPAVPLGDRHTGAYLIYPVD